MFPPALSTLSTLSVQGGAAQGGAVQGGAVSLVSKYYLFL